MGYELKDLKEKYISTALLQNIDFFEKLFQKDSIYRIRHMVLPNREKTKACLIFFDGMVSSDYMNEAVIKPLLTSEYEQSENLTDYIEQRVLFANEIKQEKDISLILADVLYGDTVLLIDGCEKGILIDTKGWRTRGISEPNDERVLQGPREGFDEAVLPNLAMLRRKLVTPDLCMENMSLGRKSDTKVYVCYLDSLVNHKTVKVIKNRIKDIDIDGILDSNYINELINTNKSSFFKTMGSTERPDIVAAKLLEGRVAVFVDGTPVVLTAPYLFCENFQSDEDYYVNYLVSAIGRVLRYLCFFVATFLPAVFTALTVFNPQLIPLNFFTAIAASRAGVPFSTTFEVLLLTVIFEVLKETGIRMQQSVGHALSIVGGLVIGQAAVEAKLISAPVLIITAISGIAGLMLPKMKAASFYLKIILVLISSVLGLFGLFVGVTVMLIYLNSLESFGVAYTDTAFSDGRLINKDGLIRARWGKMITRPIKLTKNKIRLRLGKDNND